MHLNDLIPQGELAAALEQGLIRRQTHPELPLAILNYTERCAYEGAWDDATRQCRGLIYHANTLDVVARPFPKFFNVGQPGAPDLDLDEPAHVTDKLDGSLGILYPTPGGHAVATRGSFASDQAIHATSVWKERYERRWAPPAGVTYLFEIIYPSNRVVCDYAGLDDLVLLDALSIETGLPVPFASVIGQWPGPYTRGQPYRTLREALAAEPRPNSEGLVVYLPARNERVKVKQDDYVALHRILTGTNARNVWEVAAVRACHRAISDPKHWGSFLGIDPARAEEVLALGDAWLEAVPDEFYGWVRDVTERVGEDARASCAAGLRVAAEARKIEDRRERYEYVASPERWMSGALTSEVMRLASAVQADARLEAMVRLELRAWREACPEPTAPFARDEAIA